MIPVQVHWQRRTIPHDKGGKHSERVDWLLNGCTCDVCKVPSKMVEKILEDSEESRQENGRGKLIVENSILGHIICLWSLCLMMKFTSGRSRLKHEQWRGHHFLTGCRFVFKTTLLCAISDSKINLFFKSNHSVYLNILPIY